MPTNSKILPSRISKWKDFGEVVNSGGYDVFYRDSTSGDAVVVCIHGFPTSSFDWLEVWDSLTSKYRVFAFDLLGFGFSAKPNPHNYTIAEQTDILLDLLEQRGIKKFHLLSHDYGTIVAQELLARFNAGALAPEITVKSATFLNGALFPEMHHPRLAQKLLLSPLGPLASKLFNEKKFRKTFSEIFGAETQPSDSELEEFWSLIQFNGGQSIMHLLINYIRERRVFRNRWVQAIQNTPVPICLINGVDDPVSGIHLVERARTELPKASIIELKNIGHYPQVEAPQEVADAFLRFVERVGP